MAQQLRFFFIVMTLLSSPLAHSAQTHAPMVALADKVADFLVANENDPALFKKSMALLPMAYANAHPEENFWALYSKNILPISILQSLYTVLPLTISQDWSATDTAVLGFFGTVIYSLGNVYFASQYAENWGAQRGLKLALDPLWAQLKTRGLDLPDRHRMAWLQGKIAAKFERIEKKKVFFLLPADDTTRAILKRGGPRYLGPQVSALGLAVERLEGHVLIQIEKKPGAVFEVNLAVNTPSFTTELRFKTAGSVDLSLERRIKSDANIQKFLSQVGEHEFCQLYLK